MGVGRAIKRNPVETALMGAATGGVGLLVAGQQAKKQQKKMKTLQGQADTAYKQAEEEARKKAIADESVRKQKEKARRQLMFAGNAQNNLFSPTLGGVGGQQTLG